MPQPLISLVTVVFNGEKLIADTLRSAVEQTYVPIELVIVDGGSTDKTVDVARQFQSHIGTLVSEHDKGIYDAMNKGVQASAGEWIYFLNAGDSFYDTKVLEDIFTPNRLDNVDLIYARVQTRNEPSGVDYITGEPTTFNDFFSRYPVCHQATFTRKAAFEQIGPYDIRYRLAADTEWFARFFKLQPERALFVDRVVAYYDIQGTTYHKRMQGYREYLHFGRKHFPFWVSLKNQLNYPLLWMKVKLIRMFQHASWFRAYRKMKFRNMSIDSSIHPSAK
jgi:glycosyltransferase involved in cell wall biosynthesis